MASITLSFQRGWTVGETISAYALDSRGVQTGAAVTTAAVASDGTTTFTGLADDARFVATDGTTAVLFSTLTDPTESGGGTGGHTIEDEGSALTARTSLNFVGAGVTVTDAGAKTVVTVPAGSSGFRTDSVGNLGATHTSTLGTENWLTTTGTLDANHVETIAGRAAGKIVLLRLVQDATGGRTLSISDGTTPYPVTINMVAATPTDILIVCKDATDFDVIVLGAPSTTVIANAQTANYTLVLADAGKAIDVTNASARTVTVPANASVAFPVGTVIEVTRLGAGTVTLVPDSGVTISSRGGLLAVGNQYGGASLRKTATNTWLLVGDLA